MPAPDCAAQPAAPATRSNRLRELRCASVTNGATGAAIARRTALGFRTPFFVKQAYYQAIDRANAAGNSTLAQQLRAQPSNPAGHDQDYGASIGGPVIIPKVINGKNKLFFFFSYDGFDDRKTTGTANPYTLPTLPERQGNFSDLLPASATLFQIYDPLTVQPDPNRSGHYVRLPFPGNIIPASRIINPVYQAYTKFLPTPNNPPASATGYVTSGLIWTRIFARPSRSASM